MMSENSDFLEAWVDFCCPLLKVFRYMLKKSYKHFVACWCCCSCSTILFSWLLLLFLYRTNQKWLWSFFSGLLDICGTKPYLLQGMTMNCCYLSQLSLSALFDFLYVNRVACYWEPTSIMRLLNLKNLYQYIHFIICANDVST